MEPAGDVTAPELDLDDKAQYGFVQWYHALPKVLEPSRMQPALAFLGLIQANNGSDVEHELYRTRQSCGSLIARCVTGTHGGAHLSNLHTQHSLPFPAGILFCAWRRRLVHCQAVLQDHCSCQVFGQTGQWPARCTLCLNHQQNKELRHQPLCMHSRS